MAVFLAAVELERFAQSQWTMVVSLGPIEQNAEDMFAQKSMLDLSLNYHQPNSKNYLSAQGTGRGVSNFLLL